MKIWIVGLGSGDPEALSIGCYRLLKSGLPVWLRTEHHPVVSWLLEQGIELKSFDFIYKQHSSFAQVYSEVVSKLVEQVKQTEELIYAVPGHPHIAEETVKQLLLVADQQGIEVEVKGSESFIDTAFSRLRMDPIEGFTLLNGDDLQMTDLQPTHHQLIGQVYNREVASRVKLTLMEVYPDDTPIIIIDSLGITDKEMSLEIPLYQLDREDRFHNLTSLYLPPQQGTWQLTRRFETLVALFKHLRSPEGCPWDRKQTHQTLRPYLLEEAYEFIASVDEEDSFAMEEELGDVLLQVLLHAQIASEDGNFNIYDVIQTLNEKMIRRHPHVFGREKVETAEGVLTSWEAIKKMEKGKQESALLLDEVPHSMPALMRAFALQKKVSKVGFDWDDTSGVEAKVIEEWQELLKAESQGEKEEELGDLLFTLVNLSRFLKINPEVALHRANEKFRQRFNTIEQKAYKNGVSIEEATTIQLNQWWSEAKKEE